MEAPLLSVFRQGLSETGYVEGENLVIERRWAEGQFDLLPALAADLVRQQVAVIVTTGGPQPARAARAATPVIPIVFVTGSDPVEDGLVQSLNRPGGNMTGVSNFTTSLGPKRLGLLLEMVPRATTIAFLVNPPAQTAEMQVKQVQEAARSVKRKLLVLNASTEREFDGAFTTLIQKRASALLISAGSFFQLWRDQLVALAARHAVPTMFEWPEFVVAGGLISYSADRLEGLHQAGKYVGRILNGDKPADLPIVRSTKFELAINMKTAKALDIKIPISILLQATTVIE